MSSAVQKHLGSWGYDVKCAEDFSNVISEFNKHIQMLTLFGFTNTALFMAVAGICIAIFAAIYITAYLITAKSYYKIVSE